MIKRVNKEKITAIVFLLIVSIGGILIFADAKAVGAALLIGYKNYLPEESAAFDVLEAVTDSVDDRINTIVSRNTPFIDYNGAFEKMINSRVVEDVNPIRTIYRMDNGQVTFNYPEYDVQEYIDNMVALSASLENKDTAFLYVQAPFKINKYDPQLPRGIADTTNINADKLLQGLSEKDVPYIDLREVIHDKGMDYAELFYNTDHHWKTETAFWAYGQVSQQLKDEYGIDIDPEKININNFTLDTYEQYFLGSQGRRVGKYYAGVDDYTLVLPDFDTDYSVRFIQDGDQPVSQGTFFDAIIDKNKIELLSVATNRYASYFDGVHPKIEIINHKVDEGRLLVLQDSYGLPFSAFMSLHFQQTDVLDLRHFHSQTLYEYLEHNDYDIVVFLYNLSAFSYSQMFDF